jgi:hypothetical protein
MKRNRSKIIIIIVLLLGVVWLCYPIFPWEDTYSKYLLGDMQSISASPYKEQFEESQNVQDIAQFQINDGDYRFVYLMASNNDVYYILETPNGMGKELYDLSGNAVSELYEGKYNILCGVKIIKNKLYYVYGNIYSRRALGNFVDGAATVETNGRKALFSIIPVFKPNFAVYDLSEKTVSKISKRNYIEAVNLH